MGLVKGAVAAATIGAGVLAYKGLSSMDSGDIREYGEKIKEAVSDMGAAASNSGFLNDIKGKLEGTQVGSFMLSALDSAGNGVSDGFDRLVDTVAGAKERSEADGSSFAGNLFGELTDAVSDAAEFVSEKFPSAGNVGKMAVGYLTGMDGAQAEAAEPEEPGIV